MKTIKCKRPLLIGARSYGAGEVAEIEDGRAKDLVEAGVAEFVFVATARPKVETATSKVAAEVATKRG